MLFHKIIILALLFISCTQAQNENIWIPPEKEKLLQMLDYSYNMEFDHFNRMQAQYEQKYPDRPEAYFAKVVAEWSRMSTDIHNPAYDDAFEELVDGVVDKLESFEDSHALYKVANFYINAAIGFKAIIHVTRQNWLSAALDGRIAIKGVEDALEGKIPNPDALFGTGTYLYYADIVPKKYPILKPLFYFYPEGDKKQGLLDLQETSENGVFAKVISSYMYAVILYTRENKRLDSYNIFQHLVKRYPRNPVFKLWLSAVATHLRKYDIALDILDELRQQTEINAHYHPQHKMRIIHFRYGRIYYKQRHYEKAISHLQKAIESIDPVMEEKLFRYKIYALQELGFCYNSMGRLTESKTVFEQVLSLDEHRNSHETAKKYISQIDVRLAQQDNPTN